MGFEGLAVRRCAPEGLEGGVRLQRLRQHPAALGSQLVGLQVQPRDPVLLHRLHERLDVLGAEQLGLEVHGPRPVLGPAPALDDRVAVRLDHLVLDVLNELRVAGDGESAAARQLLLERDLDLGVLLELPILQDRIELHARPLHLGLQREDEVLDAAAPHARRECEGGRAVEGQALGEGGAQALGEGGAQALGEGRARRLTTSRGRRSKGWRTGRS